jgi:hypothetical protein
MTEEDIATIENMAGCNYAPSDIAIYLGTNVGYFLKEYNTEGSVIQQAYYRGRLIAQYEINNKQRELAMTGNITATQIFLKESKELEAVNIRNKCLGLIDN